MKRKALRRLEPVPFAHVSLTDFFWSPRIETNRKKTIPAEYVQCKRTGQLDAWKWKPGKPKQPHIFWDSDVAKWIEAAAYDLALHPNRSLEKKVDDVVNAMEKVQMADGYLNSHYILVEPQNRWTNLRDRHELYCAGHLMEAAAAYYQATGKRKFFDIMCRYANHIARTFGPKKDQKRGYPGHQEIELALVKLYRATGRKSYLDLAEFFVNERGKRPHYFDLEAKARGAAPSEYRGTDYRHHQAHTPVRKQDTAEGHAVRAMYLYAGMADVAGETGDKTLLEACRRLWKNVTGKRMYVTGGIGSTRNGERFTFDYDLPNEEAYAETCAAIGLVFWAHRMLQIDPDGCYADVMERALYNNVPSGVSLDGRGFFYENPLAVHPDAVRYYRYFRRSGDPARKEWFGCSCCPPNIARLYASLGEYIYGKRRNEAWIHLYAAGRAAIDIGSQTITLEQETGYPWKEKVVVKVSPARAASFPLALRIPGWCRKAALKVNGRTVRPPVRKGYARIKRTWKKGDRVELTLPMPVELVEAHPGVRANAGRVAIQRGPVVYCLEEADNGRDLQDLVLNKSGLRAKYDPRLLGGVCTVTGKAYRREWKGGLYDRGKAKRTAVNIKAVPFATWANRRVGEMAVWILRSS